MPDKNIILCGIVLILICTPVTLSGTYSGGSGTIDDPYRIATAEDLIALGQTTDDYDKHFILTDDIDLSGYTFDKAVIAPQIGRGGEFRGIAFTGTFNGDGHKILHLTIQGYDFLGLFGQLEQLASPAMIFNLGLEEVDIHGNGPYVGGLCGSNGDSEYNPSGGTISNCHVTGTVSGRNHIGGLIAWNSGSITTCYSNSIIIGEDFVGGLVGYNYWSSSISASYSTGMVTGVEYVGGLIGYNCDGCISTCYSTAMVSGNSRTGGLVGVDLYGTINKSFWDVDISGQLDSAGGTGLTTDQMQQIDTFLEEGWDFTDEIANGTCDYWQISEDEYPRLHFSGANHPVMPEGLGTYEQPYLIRDTRDLGTVWFEPLAHYRMETSVDLSGITWLMAPVPCFGGRFDGNDHVIRNLHIQGGGHLGLFGRVISGAKIFNIGLEAIEVHGTDDYVGGLAGYNHGNIIANYSNGKISGNDYIGGLTGFNDWGGSISLCNSNGSVIGTGLYIGGLAGFNDGNIISCNSTSYVNGSNYFGGLVGQNDYVGYVIASHSSGRVGGSGGGLVGVNLGSVTKCFWDVKSSGRPYSDGGIGLTPELIQQIDKFLNEGWDCANETVNGTSDYWQISAGEYPQLHYHSGNRPVMPEGLGTAEKPYLLRDATDLGKVCYEPCAHYRLEASVDLSGTTWSIAPVPWFRGQFDGNDNRIHNLHIQGDSHLGLFGKTLPGTIISNLGLETAEVHGTGIYIGSLVAINSGTITDSFCTSTIDGNHYVGALVGWNQPLSYITTSYSTSMVSGERSSGGLVGLNFGIISSCYSTGTMEGDNLIGGLVGWNDIGSSVIDCYSTAAVSGEWGVGGLVGLNWGGSIVSNSFWDIETSGMTTSDGGTGLSTARMQDIDTFLSAGWDFVNVWDIGQNQTYPYLRKYSAADLNKDKEVNLLDLSVLSEQWLMGQ
ncbi:MAG: hypothetical protein JXA82_15380 [Sedimentisphaerales bacterium]|nr:hypothetical protein [Sedimentisphaerales bacterium]